MFTTTTTTTTTTTSTTTTTTTAATTTTTTTTTVTDYSHDYDQSLGSSGQPGRGGPGSRRSPA